MPCGCEGEGLHLPPIPETLKRAWSDIKYPAQGLFLYEALFFDVGLTDSLRVLHCRPRLISLMKSSGYRGPAVRDGLRLQ